MSLRKKIILISIMLVLIISTILVFWTVNNVRQTREPINFAEIIEQGRVDELTLAIYYWSPYYLTPRSWGVDDVMDEQRQHVVAGDILKKHIDLLKQLDDAVLVPVEYEAFLNARMHYVFEHRRSRRTFTVSMWGWGCPDMERESIFVNGVAVEEERIFYDVLMQFLPEDLAMELETYLKSFYPPRLMP